MNGDGMKKYRSRIIVTAALLLSLPCIPSIGCCDEGVPAEIPTMVKFSNKGINRIVCSGEFSDLIFSDKKNLSGKFSGNSAFIEFVADDVGGKMLYPSEPAEIYAVCDGVVYTIIAAPTAGINVAVVRLAPPKSNDVQKNIDHFKNMPVEKQALQVIREAYEGNYPSSYKVTDQSGAVNICPDLNVVLHQQVDVDGIGMRLKEYKVTANRNVDVDEKTFLKQLISDAILAVAVEDHKLTQGQSTRVFIVEKKAVEADRLGFEHSELNFRMGAKSK